MTPCIDLALFFGILRDVVGLSLDGAPLSLHGHEDVERLQPCAACGSRRYCFDGWDWRCIRCEPSVLDSLIVVSYACVDC
jgi:hypothetical protein